MERPLSARTPISHLTKTKGAKQKPQRQATNPTEKADDRDLYFLSEAQSNSKQLGYLPECGRSAKGRIALAAAFQ
eukprot:5423219-Amphidinium_carterae.1